jgi:hypothetical protein
MQAVTLVLSVRTIRQPTWSMMTAWMNGKTPKVKLAILRCHWPAPAFRQLLLWALSTAILLKRLKNINVVKAKNSNPSSQRSNTLLDPPLLPHSPTLTPKQMATAQESFLITNTSLLWSPDLLVMVTLPNHRPLLSAACAHQGSATSSNHSKTRSRRFHMDYQKKREGWSL